MSSMEQPVRIEPNRRYTVEEYFQIEAASEERYEYYDGQIKAVGEALAMSGGSMEHSFIACNLARMIGNKLVGTPCRVFNADLRVRVGRKLRYVYPDIGIVCGTPLRDMGPSTGHTLLNPRVIIEVLSPSTESVDRGAKFESYREIDSLEEYIVVAQDAPRVESFLRQGDGTWSLMPTTGLEAVAKIRCLPLDLRLCDIYSGVDLKEPSATDGGGA
jgi:Uma2 family endonuclease